MKELTIEAAQSDMRHGYLCGVPGILASGSVWLIAGIVAALGSEKAAVLALLIGGVAIHPVGVAVAKLLGYPGAHTPGNPLGRLAAESTFWLVAGCAIAYGMHVLRIEWFFPAMLLVIGGRYLTFQTLYGLRAYWVCGALLCAAGLALALTRAPTVAGAFTGAAIELFFAAVLSLGGPSALRPNPSVEARPNGKPLWPRKARYTQSAMRGQSVSPSVPPHLER